MRVLERHDCDVTDVQQVVCAYDRHRPDMVVNCAGVSDENDPVKTINVNLLGSLNVLSQSVVPTVLIASVAGMYGKPNHAAYCASKAGVISLVQSYSMMHLPVWAVSPGRVDTPMRERDYPDDKPGSRLHPEQVGTLIQDILVRGFYESGTNILIRKKGFSIVITQEHTGDGWKERLCVGSPKLI